MATTDDQIQLQKGALTLLTNRSKQEVAKANIIN